jgi:cobalamin transport system substrate-binding protein
VLAPAAAETLARLGVVDQVVGVGDWVVWPPEMARLPKLGAYDTPSEERLLELGVDTLITATSSAGRQERSEIARLGIEVVELDTSTFDGTFAAIGTLGELVDRRDEARALEAEIRARLDRVGSRVGRASRPRVLVAVGREPLYVAGPGSHLGELVTLAGGTNVAADLSAPYAMVSEEAMLAREPEVIIDTSDNRPDAPRGAVALGWGRWSFVPAVRDGRVFELDPIRLSIPGPRLGEMAELVAHLIHPELFGAPRADDFGPLPGSRP